jgi:hypothetical protein
MNLVYTHQNIALVMNINTVLMNAGIKTQIRNEYSAGGSGEIPCFETWPEVWVVQENHLAKAQLLVSEVMKKDAAPDWICDTCGESNGPAFDFCWQCSTMRKEVI